jgi:hypothetical protein
MAAAAENIRYHQIRSADKKGNGTQIQMFGGGSSSTGDAAVYDSGGNIVPAKSPYDVVVSFVGKPGAAALVFLLTFTRAVAFTGNFSGSAGTVGTNPTATATYTVAKNGSSIGTIVVSTGGVVTFTTTSGAAQSFASGDRMTVTAPSSQDATLSDAAFTLAGTR